MKTYLCYFCGSKNYDVIQDTLRHGEKRKVLKCKKCDLVFLAPYHGKDLEAFYRSSEYRKKHSPVLGKAITPKKMFDISLPLQAYRVSKIKPYLKKHMRVLEVGCSTGHFLYAIKPFVKERAGIELNKTHAVFARKKVGVKISEQPIEKSGFPENHFDIICAYQVLEHIEAPREFLSAFLPYLKKDGRIFIEVPNINDPLLTIYKIPSYQQFYYHDAHLFYYSAHTLKDMMRSAGFEGKVEGFQLYNFLNHIHWLFAGKPQANATIATGEPFLIADKKNKYANVLNTWMGRVDKEYRAMLEKNLFSDCLLYIGKRKIENAKIKNKNDNSKF